MLRATHRSGDIAFAHIRSISSHAARMKTAHPARPGQANASPQMTPPALKTREAKATGAC
jgi:hypothetical protein